MIDLIILYISNSISLLTNNFNLLLSNSSIRVQLVIMWIQSHWIIDRIIRKLSPSIEQIKVSWQPQNIVALPSIP